jgi:hypothetical protein
VKRGLYDATSTTATASTLGTSTTGTTVVETTTTTTLPLTDSRFPETNLSARFTGPDGEPVDVGFDPNSLLALFYRHPTDHLTVVITGFDPDVMLLECGWAYMYYGPESVLQADNWYTAPFDSFSNQPWATEGATAEARCEEEFLEGSELRPDILTAQQCGDVLVFTAFALALNPAEVEAEVATPFVAILAELRDSGGVVEIEAVPWVAHPGAQQTTADLVGFDPDTLDCAA